MGTGNSSADFGYQGGDVDSGSTLGITTRSGLVLRAGSSLRPGGADGAGEVHSHGYSSGISQQLDVSFQKEPHVLVQSGGLQGMPLPQSLMQQGSERLQLNISTRGANASGASRTHVRPIHKYHMVKNESSVASIGVHRRQKQQCNVKGVSYVCTLAAYPYCVRCQPRCTGSNVQTRPNTHKHTRAHTRPRARARAHAHTHINRHTRTHVHERTHTHTGFSQATI